MRSSLFTGRYLFHLHTTCTDGHLTVPQYFEVAEREGVERLIFLEHIRANPGYDVERFVAEVAAGAAASGRPAHVGFEAKLLPGGALDISDEDAGLAEVIGIAEHGFPPDFALWRSSLARALERSAAAYPGKEIVWVHPGLWLKKHGLVAKRWSEYRALVSLARALGVKVEWNLRYDLLPAILRESLPGGDLVIGADAHRMEDLEAVLGVLPPGDPAPTGGG